MLVPTADELLGKSAITRLIACLERAVPGRPLATLRQCATSLGPKTFRQRVDAVRAAILADLPEDYAPFAAIVRAALRDSGFSGWLIAPVAEAVAARALAEPQEAAFDDGLALLAELTPRLTAEFAIRPFLDADLDRALPAVLGWTTHPGEHVRRLASEGTRPRLPWGKSVPAILARPEATLPILDALYRDSSEYVRRSVANHLNDLSRAHPALAVGVATGWLADPDTNTPQVVRHGLRTLVKQGHPQALALLGFAPLLDLIVDGPRLADTVVAVGGRLPFDFTLENRGEYPARVAVDYVIYHQKANGTLIPKVFKLATRTLAPGEKATIARKHSFKPITTRTYHPGEHAIALQVNGQLLGRTTFHLTIPG
jgi:3-methyladenine DNA glycosylase AlkC